MEPASPLLKILQDAVANLTYPSDSDEPWSAFVWPTPKLASAPRIALEKRVDRSRAIVEVPVEMFFEQLSAADDAERYAQLRTTLRNTLDCLNVFRVGDGEVRVDIYLVGIGQSDGSFAGVQTVSVES